MPPDTAVKKEIFMKIILLKVDDLIDFSEHPFKVMEDEEMNDLVESILERGVLEPIIVRPFNGKYEIIAGHRRKTACLIAGLGEIPAIISNLSDNEAAVMVVDSNLHRDHLLPSEKAYAFKLKYEALKQQGKRNDLTSGAECRKLEKSERQIRYYIRLTNLVYGLLDKVDSGNISIKAGAELSYLDVASQVMVNEFIDSEICNISEKQAKEIRSNFEQGSLFHETLKRIFCDEIEDEKFYLETKRLRSYFPKNYSLKECKDAVWRILENWFKRKKGNIDDIN